MLRTPNTANAAQGQFARDALDVKAALHPREQERLAALARYDILDTPAEPEFDEIAELVATICQTPIAVVNLIAEGRQFFKAEIGIGTREMPLEPSICAHAILLEDMMVVPDTADDPRFIDNPLVNGDPGLRFYAGASLKSDDGLPLGTLCVLDLRPRELDQNQLRAIQILSRHVMHLLEMRITRKREEALHKQAERLLKAKRRMIDAVSHDLRSPLQTISLSAQLLAHRQDAELQNMAQRLERMSRQMAALLDDLRDHHSLEIGDFSLQAEPICPRRLLEQLRDEFALTAEKEGVELHMDCAGPLGTISADPNRCRQLMGNLIQNAIKFTPPGGAVRVSGESAPNGVRLAVSDDGIGIQATDLEHLFDPYWRSDQVGERPGTGLGLSIVQTLARAHGAQVEVVSQPGHGSTFSVLFKQ